MNTPSHIIELPALRDMLRIGARQLAENVLAPLAVFYAVLATVGMRGAIIGALSWCYLAILARLVLRRPVPAVLVVTALLLSLRTVVGLATGSVFLYFLQPSLENFVLGALFLASVPLGRPLVARLAGDFCALPADLLGHIRLRQFFSRVSMLWAAVFAVNGLSTLWVLLRLPAVDFPLVSTALSFTAVLVAAGSSLVWFRRSLGTAGVRLRLGPSAS